MQLYLAEANNPQVSSWYSSQDIVKLFEWMSDEVKDPKFFPKINRKFHRDWKAIEPFIKKEKNLATLEELKNFREAVVKFYWPYTIMCVLPNIPQMVEKYTKIAMGIRESTQNLVNDIDDVFLEFFNREFPRYRDIGHYLTAQEVFSLKKAKFSELKLFQIRERRDEGYLLFNDTPYFYSELSKILRKNNIELQDYKPKKIILTKEHSREYSLFRLASWRNSMGIELNKLVGLGQEKACAIYEGKDLVSVYYEPDELKKVFGAVLGKCSDPESIKKEIETFLNLFEKLKRYYTGQKKIQSIEELKTVQELYSLVWAYIAIMFIIPHLAVDKEIQQLALEARAQTQEYNETPEEIFSEALERFFPKLKGQTRFILPEEIWSKEVENTEKMLKKIKQREKGFIFYKNKLYTGNLKDNLDKLGLELVDTESAVSGKIKKGEENELRGQTAFRGKIRGRVRVISSIKYLDEVQEGDILVASMTMPKYLPAMKKATAFVTDEGGITCHAAIIAREMKKPCIIGTKIATQILKDGDVVEVDADNGIVKILGK